MKIIKQGNINKLKAVIRFTCSKCGCIFEADNTEYKISSQYNEEYCYCECPFCHKFCYKVI